MTVSPMARLGGTVAPLVLEDIRDSSQAHDICTSTKVMLTPPCILH
jgi:hypothetical protein